MKKNNDNFMIEDPSIQASDFAFVDPKSMVHEQKFSTKPTTFFKDSIKRFRKNKSSVVAGVILGAMLLLSFTIPLFDNNDITVSHPEISYLQPKLFAGGTGFWDGTKQWNNIPTDLGNDPEGLDKEANWWPSPADFRKEGIVEGSKKFSDLTYTSSKSEYAKGGFVQVGYYNNIEDSKEYVYFKPYYALSGTSNSKFNPSKNAYYLTNFVMFNKDQLLNFESKSTPANYTLGEAALYLTYSKKVETVEGEGEDQVTKVDYVKESIALTEYKTEFAITESNKINISNIIKEDEGYKALALTDGALLNASVEIRVKNKKNHENTCVCIQSLGFDTTQSELHDSFTGYSFNDANTLMLQESEVYPNGDESQSKVQNYSYWVSSGALRLFGAKVYYCSFIYDSYEAILGTHFFQGLSFSKIDEYRRKKWLRCPDLRAYQGSGQAETEANLDDLYLNDKYLPGEDTLNPNYIEILNPDECPIVSLGRENFFVLPNGEITINCQVTYYKYYGYKTMPSFLFGTDKTGRDMLKYVAEGLRTSLLLGILTFAVCFTFGLIYGAVSGYFGGTVDLVMERFTDILSGVPWIVVMTLAVLKLGSTFWTFALSLCLTGWIGTAATTRTQFYRFRGREYVLASRTLGATDARLISKHILPNAMGTIVTSSVLMIPSVIFSEATISYLGLGLKNLSSLGVILSNNQNELSTNAYLLIFPSVVIALLMVCFNLFGNGLRDAINPSLKGEEA